MIITRRVTKQEARYTDAGGQEKCAYCRFFAPQGWCGKVAGPVSPEGWCKYYSREMVQRSSGAGYAGSGGGPPPGATADLSFMTPGTLPPNVVFTRASTATYFDASGALQTAATNAPRWDYDPATLALRGVLMESGKTNLVLNSAALVTQGVAVTAQVYTLSFQGPGSVAMSGAFAGTLPGVAPPGRAAVTFTPAAGTLTLTVTGSVLNAQLEAGGFASSYIPTTGASATRAAEHCALTDAVLFGGTTDRTVAVQGYIRQGTPAGVVSYWISASDGSVNNFMNFIAAATLTIRGQVTVGGVVKLSGGDRPYVAPVAFKAALANGAIWNGAINGVLMPATGGVSQQLGPLTVLRVGEGPIATQMADGWIQRVLYWPRALSQAELLQATT